MKEQDIISAKKTIETEIIALREMEENFDESLSNALDILENTKGRIVVTGMGKSGHIARKIAATLASTGSPSFFVHPAEASHGDLGMLTSNDSVIAISNGGESKELSDVLAYSKRYEIPLIAMTKNPDLRSRISFPPRPRSTEEIHCSLTAPWLLACSLTGKYDRWQVNSYRKYYDLIDDDLFYRDIIDATRIIFSESRNITVPAAFLAAQFKLAAEGKEIYR